MNESYLEKLISLIKQGIINVEQIKDVAYKAEVINRLIAST
jgi:hypothetical protein